MKLLHCLSLRGVAFFGVALYTATTLLLADPDYFWHLRTGQYLLATGTLPGGDIFSFTQPGKPWVLHEWLFEVLLALFYQAAGEAGVRAFVAALGAATVWVSYVTARKFLRSAYIAFALALLMYVFVKMGLSPRPQLLTYLFAAISLRILIGFKYFGEDRALIALPGMMVVWVNVHAGYLSGLGLIGLFLVAGVLDHLHAGRADARQTRRLRRLGLIFLFCVLASLLNPYGYQHWLYPLQVMGMDVARGAISEWRSLDFHHFTGQAYLALVIGYFMLGAYRKTRPDVAELLIPALLAATGFMAMRHVPLAGILLMPFVARAIADMAPMPQHLANAWGKVAAAYQARRGQDLGAGEGLLNALLLVVVALSVTLYAPQKRAMDQAVFDELLPVRAVDFMVAHRIGGRLFSSYDFGGYLIHRLYPAQKVFIDGRADVYGDAFIKDYADIVAGKADWAARFDRYDIDCLLLQRDAPLSQLLQLRGDFVRVYDDENYSVLVKKTARFASLIDRT